VGIVVGSLLGLVDAPQRAAAAAPRTDPLYTSSSGPEGFTVVRLDAANGGEEALATIRPEGGVDGDDWLGYQCTTGDGAWVVAVVAQRGAVNRHVLRDRGGLAYAVSTATGAVRPLTSGVAFKYHTPGCGADARVALLRHTGVDQVATEVLSFDLATSRLLVRHHVGGQLTFAVPLGDRVAAVRGSRVIVLDSSGGESMLADPRAVGSHPFALRPRRSGGLDLLVADLRGARTTVVRTRTDVGQGSASGPAWQAVGSGPLQAVDLVDGPGDRSTVVGLDAPATARAGLHVLPAARGRALAASAEGSVLLARRDQGGPGAERALLRTDGTTVRPLASAPSVRRATAWVVVTARPAPVGQVGAVSRWAVEPGAPACTVPRNDVRRQVPQPNATQVDWAIQQASRNNLTGANARPAGFLNLGLPGYSPSLDFPRLALGGGAGSPVPPSVIQGTFAQESNWMHASPRALPGIPGNPNVSDYYGAGGTLDRIDYAQADCGYGLAQITDPMTVASTLYTPAQKAKVAVDYAANAQAGVSFLVNKWNQLHESGITANGGDPRYLENWYFALWAYNTGLNVPDAAGRRGLGWTNNPIQADYPPNRTPFLRATYADAERPGDWPYQERVIGWMETPLRREGRPAYQSTGRYLTLPAISRFCDDSNDCDPTFVDPSGQGRSYCKLADRHCWWHEPVAFVQDGCAQTTCVTSQFTVPATAREPAASVNHPHACQTSLPAGTVVVDNQPDPVNVLGCRTPNWHSEGSFEVRYGTTRDGVPLGEIDWHQLGTGLGGHLWFSKNRVTPGDVHVNVGTWTPPARVRGFYEVLVHLPGGGHGAGASAPVAYEVFTDADGPGRKVVIDQRRVTNQWVSLGTHEILTGGRVALSNYTAGTPTNPITEPGTVNIAYDAVMFVPSWSQPLPLLIAHGFTDTPENMTNLENIARAAVGPSLRTHRVRLGAFAGIEANAQILITEAERLRAETGAPRVNVIGHSKGGLDARKAMWDRPELFNALGMLGTPNLGSPWAELACSAWSQPSTRPAIEAAFGGCEPGDALYQLRPAFMSDFNRRNPDRAEHRLYTAAGDCTALDESGACLLTTVVLGTIPDLDLRHLCGDPGINKHDGVVCVGSAYGMSVGTRPDAKHYRSGRPFTNHDHLELAWDMARPCPARFLLRDIYGVSIGSRSCAEYELVPE
jgi:hypothetical protein